jgi:predicted nucleic acid-binding protein
MKYPPYTASAPLKVNDGNSLNDWLSAQNPQGDFLDVNVWVVLASPEHKHHKHALSYWAAVQQANRQVWFCRTTMLGMVRLLSQRAMKGDHVLKLQAAYALYREFLGLPFVHWLPETVSRSKQIDSQMFKLLGDIPSRMSTDAYLAAVAQSTGLRMVTFDADFKRFDLEGLLLLAA